MKAWQKTVDWILQSFVSEYSAKMSHENHGKGEENRCFFDNRRDACIELLCLMEAFQLQETLKLFQMVKVASFLKSLHLPTNSTVGVVPEQMADSFVQISPLLLELP